MTKKHDKLFIPGQYYLVDSDDMIVLSASTFAECKQAAMEGDTILLCMGCKGLANKKKLEKPKKAIVDFIKNILTIEEGSVTLNGVEFKSGTYDMDYNKNWIEVVKICNSNAEKVEIIGVPPINGKDITNEMSNL